MCGFERQYMVLFQVRYRSPYRKKIPLSVLNGMAYMAYMACAYL